MRINALTMGETIHETNMNTPAKVGLLGGQVQGGTLDLAGAVSVTLVNPDADAKGNITLAELQNTNISALAGVSTTANSLSGSLPMVATLGSTTFAGSPTATLTSTNVFAGSPPDITGNAGFEEIANFNNISAGDLLTVLDRVASGWQDIAPSLDVNASLGGIPYVDTQPSEVVDFNALVGRVSRGLYDPVLTAQSPLNLAAGGRLSDNAVFSIRSNDSQTTAVTLLAANQQVGESIVTFFNRSLPPTLIGKITASQISTAQGTNLSLKATDPAITKLEILISDRTNPITKNLGFEPSQFSSPAFKFDTVQTFIPVLAQLMGLTAAQVNPQYDPATHALSFQTSFQGMNFSQSVPFDFSDGLGPLTYLTPASGTFTSTPTASARVGLELAGLQTVLTATGDAPADGRLAATAHFSVTLNGTSPVTVVVGRDATNSSLDDLVADLNSSLKFSGLGGLVAAGRNGSRITLTSATGSTLHVDAAASDTAATQMFLPGDGSGAQWGQHVYLVSGAQVNIASQIVDSSISGAAALGIQPVTLNNSTATITLNTGATLASQTHLGDLRRSASSVLNVAAPAVTLAGHFVLSVDPALGVSAGNPAFFDLGLTTPNQLATVLTAAADGPANGQLSGAAHLSLTLGEGTPVDITVAADASNVSLDDLIADINTAISATRLRGSIVAGRSGNRITLSASGFDSLAITSPAGDPTQTDLHLGNAVANPAVDYTVNVPFRDKLASLRSFGTDDFVTSVQGILDLFQTGKLNALTAKIPMLNQSVDDVLGVTQKLKNAVQQLLGKAGTNLKIATQGSVLSSFRSALAGLQLSLPEGSTDDLFALYDALRIAAQNSGRTDVPHAVDLASTIVASITPLTQAIARLNQPGVDVAPLNNVLNLLKQATPALPEFGPALATILNLGSAGTVTSQFVNANPSGSEPSLVMRVNWLPNVTRGMSLGTLKMPNGLGPLKFAAGSTVNMTVNGDLKLDFGYNTVTGTPFLADTSHFNATASFGTADASYAATIGGVSVTLGHTGNPNPLAGDPADPVSFQLLHDATNPPASLVVTVAPTPDPNDLGFIPFSSAAGSLVDGNTSGHLHAKLPVYVTGNDRGDITVDWDFPKPAVADPIVTAPADLIPTLQSLPYNFQILTDGIRDWTSQFEQLLSNEVLGNFPLIQAGVDVSGGFISALQNQFYNAVSSAISASGGGDSAQFRQNLYDAVNAALSTLLVVDTLSVSLPDNPAPEVRFEIHGHDLYHAGLRLGLDGLGLDDFDVSATPVDVNLDYDLQLGFGISKTEGFYFIVAPAAPQFTLNVGAVLDPAATVTTELFSLPVVAQGNVDAGMQSLTRVENVGLDITVLDPDGHMTSEQLDPLEFPLAFRTVVGAGGANAHFDVHLRAEAFDGSVPSFSTDLRVDQHFNPGVLLSDGDNPQVRLDNIGLDMGSALGKIVQPIVRDINSFLAPIRPVVKALGETVPVLSRFSGGRVTWIDLLGRFSDDPDAQQQVDNIKKLIEIFNALDSLVQKANALSSSTTLINFGYYEFNPGHDLRQGDPHSLNPFDPSIGTFHPSFAATNDGTISPAVLGAVEPGVRSYLTTDLQDRGVHFPIFEDPSLALAFLFGKDATLITWQLPEFKIGAEVYDQYLGTYPVGPIPVSVYLGLYLGVSFNVGVGFDTRGLRADHEFEDGFFFIDVGASGPPVIDFRTGLSITGTGGIPYVGEAGVRGTVYADILAHWKDDDRDGKVHLDELLANLDQGPECVFDITGRLSFQLSMYASGLGISVSFPASPEITLFEFTNKCPPLPPPELAHLSSGSDLDYLGNAIPAGTLVLNIGPYAGLRQPGVSKDSNERLHVYEFDPGIITVSGFGQSKTYGDEAHPVQFIYGDAGLGNNTLLFDSTVMAETTLLGGPGNDVIRGGSGRNHIIGRGGKDTLIGGAGDDNIESGVGDAKIYGLAGKDLIVAEGGNNYIDGGDDDDELHGGSGNDQIFGGTGNDRIFGGGGTGQIFGERGNDYHCRSGKRRHLYRRRSRRQLHHRQRRSRHHLRRCAERTVG